MLGYYSIPVDSNQWLPIYSNHYTQPCNQIARCLKEKEFQSKLKTASVMEHKGGGSPLHLDTWSLKAHELHSYGWG